MPAGRCHEESQESHRRKLMPKAKLFEKSLTYGAKAGWAVFSRSNPRSPNTRLPPKPKEKPPLGWPRTTDSLCPKCIPEIRQQIVDGKLPHEILLNEKVGEINAQI